MKQITIKITMNPTEKHAKHMLYVLRNIRERSLFAKPEQKTLYNLAPHVYVADDSIPNYEDEVALLEQLHAQQVIAIGTPHHDQDSYGDYAAIDGYYLTLIEPAFSKLYEKYEKIDTTKGMQPGVTNTSPSKPINIDDFSYSDNDELSFMGLKSSMPKNSNQSELCKAMFRRRNGEWTDWDVVYEEIQGSQPKGNEHKKIYDAVEAINERTKQDIGLKIFEYANKQVRFNPRMY